MVSQIFLGITLAGILTALVSLVVLHIVPTRLSPIRDAVSAYGISRYWQLYRIQTVATGVAAIALAIALPLRLSSGTVFAIIFLATFGVARMLISWFPMDKSGMPRTETGHVHGLLAIITFTAISASGFKIAIAFASDPNFRTYANVANLLAWMVTAASLITLLSIRIPVKYVSFGIFERLIYLGMFGLLGYSAIVLL